MSPSGEAVLHEGAEDLADLLGPVLRAGLDRGDDVVVVGTGKRPAVLAEAALGPVTVLPPQEVWRRPAAAIATYLDLAERAAEAGRELLLVSDEECGAGPVDWSEWARFEAASHALTDRYPVRRFCLSDLDEVPAEVAAANERLHPVVRRGGTVRPSPSYVGYAASVARDGYVAADPMEDGRPALVLDDVAGPDDLARARHAVAVEVARHGLPEWRSYELVLAVGEVLANAVRHGRPPARVRFWATPHRLLCTVTDSGAGFDFPLSCYLAREPAEAGLGLYLARQVADQMNVRWTPDGFTVRLALVLDPPVTGS